MRKYWFISYLLFAALTGLAQPYAVDYSAIDRHARRAPEEIAREAPALTDYLVSEAENDFERARAIYTWITHNIRYDEEALQSGRKRLNRSNTDILRRRRAICFGYSQLFKAMSTRAGLACEVVSGYSKGTLTSTPRMDKPDHAWNAVRLDGRWYLLDATWGAAVVQRGNAFVETAEETYFLAAPDQFILNHLPQNPMWQLLDRPVDAVTFQQPADSISVFLARRRPYFVFEDSIRLWRALPRSEQRLREAETAYAFHPTPDNRRELGHVYMDFAGDLSDTIDQLPPDRPLDTLLTRQDQIIRYCELARQHADTLYNWQRELHISTLINQAAALYQHVYNETDQKILQSAYAQMRNLLRRAQEVITELPPDSLYGRQTARRCKEYLEVIE